MKLKSIVCVSLQLFCRCLLGEENFILIDGISNEKVLEIGPNVNERITPCSTFKIALSLIGFDSALLKDENAPVWLFQEGYDDFIESWKSPQTPQSWLKTSCIWYSRVLAAYLGEERLQSYLAAMEYGNQDISGSLDCAWVCSSLKISPAEQVSFIQKMLGEKLPISSYAVHITKKLIFIEKLANEWELFGKTGWTGSNRPDGEKEFGWFVGWIEKGDLYYPLAYNIRAEKVDLGQRIPRVKQLLKESGVMN